MKKLLIVALLFISANAFSQIFYENIEPMSIVKPEMENEVIDPSVFADLEKFNDENDAIVYLIRTKSMVGAAAKWAVEVDKKKVANLKNKEYFVFHVDASVEGHSVQLPNLKFNYTNFKPNRYYYIMTKGFGVSTGYFNAEALKEMKKTNLTKH